MIIDKCDICGADMVFDYVVTRACGCVESVSNVCMTDIAHFASTPCVDHSDEGEDNDLSPCYAEWLGQEAEFYEDYVAS